MLRIGPLSSSCSGRGHRLVARNEPLDLCKSFQRGFLGQEVPAIDRASSHPVRHFTPIDRAVKQLAHHGSCSPQGKDWCVDLAAAIGSVMFEVDCTGSAIILAGCMNGPRIRESTHIGVNCLWIEGRKIWFGTADTAENIERHLT